MGLLGLCVIDEEIYRSAVLLPKSPVNVILYECNDDQAPKYLEPVLRGEKRTAFAQTEPQSGSDPGGSMETARSRTATTGLSTATSSSSATLWPAISGCFKPSPIRTSAAVAASPCS